MAKQIAPQETSDESEAALSPAKRFCLRLLLSLLSLEVWLPALLLFRWTEHLREATLIRPWWHSPLLALAQVLAVAFAFGSWWALSKIPESVLSGPSNEKRWQLYHDLRLSAYRQYRSQGLTAAQARTATDKRYPLPSSVLEDWIGHEEGVGWSRHVAPDLLGRLHRWRYLRE